MSYRIEFKADARRKLLGLDRPIRRRVEARINALADDPRPHGVETLTGPERLYRVRVGDYRIVYAIEDRALVVLVVRVGHRREIYRGL